VSKFVTKELPRAVERELKRLRQSFTNKTLEKACFDAHLACNVALDTSPRVRSRISGTTSVSVCFWKNQMTVCNVGDSRTIVGKFSADDNSIVAEALSRDQILYREDERNRVKKCGARVLTMDQIYNNKEADDDWNDDHVGKNLRKGNDNAPRLWVQEHKFPGLQFTRSFGDFIVRDIGVHAEPEILTREINDSDKFIVLATDGVWEFLTNQDVANICSLYADPKDACHAIVKIAFQHWLENDTRTDDITVICIYLDEMKPISSTIPQSSNDRFRVKSVHATNESVHFGLEDPEISNQNI